MSVDHEKFRQALQEFAWTFGLLFALSFAGWVSGWTKLPNLGEVQSAFAAALSAAAVGAAKAILWYFTGKKAPKG